MAIENHPDADEEAAQRAQLAQALASSGFEDVHIVDRETCAAILTEKRQELIDRIRKGDIRSVRGLAKDLDRDPSGISRDLDLLFEHDIVEFDTKGRRKIPRLKHDTVVAEPIA